MSIGSPTTTPDASKLGALRFAENSQLFSAFLNHVLSSFSHFILLLINKIQPSHSGLPSLTQTVETCPLAAPFFAVAGRPNLRRFVLHKKLLVLFNFLLQFFLDQERSSDSAESNAEAQKRGRAKSRRRRSCCWVDDDSSSSLARGRNPSSLAPTLSFAPEQRVRAVPWSDMPPSRIKPRAGDGGGKNCTSFHPFAMVGRKVWAMTRELSMLGVPLHALEQENLFVRTQE